MMKKSKRVRSRTLARQVVRTLSFEDGDIIAIKKGTDITEDVRMFEALRNAIGAVGKERCIVVIVDEFEDITTLGEKEMATYGWCKCGEIWLGDDEEE